MTDDLTSVRWPSVTVTCVSGPSSGSAEGVWPSSAADHHGERHSAGRLRLLLPAGDGAPAPAGNGGGRGELRQGRAAHPLALVRE